MLTFENKTKDNGNSNSNGSKSCDLRDIKALSARWERKLVSNEMKMIFFVLLYNWLQYFYYFSRNVSCENLCETVCHSFDGSVEREGKSFRYKNTRTPLAMHASVAVKECFRILSFNFFRWMSLTRWNEPSIDFFFSIAFHEQQLPRLCAKFVLLP